MTPRGPAILRLTGGWIVAFACWTAAAQESSGPVPENLAGKAVSSAAIPQLPSEAATPEPRIEQITERYPDGSIRIERQVTQDAEGNYVNHGVFTEYDPKGRILRGGEYCNGKLNGRWVQNFDAGQQSLFSGRLDKQFQGPFVAEATFSQGKLHGAWVIRSAGGRKIIQWQFDNGVRQGKSTWWYPNGAIRRDVSYKDGQPDGDMVEYNPDGKVRARFSFIEGRQIVPEVEWSAPGRKSYEGHYVLGTVVSSTIYDWWNGVIHSEPIQGQPAKLKHGAWTAWYANGQIKVRGSYDMDAPTGRFTWWYENGQKQAEGQYAYGRKNGKWLTWHVNGQKESEGTYVAGVLIAKWTRWSPDGKVAEIVDYSLDGSPRSQTGPHKVLPVPALDPPAGESVKADPAGGGHLKAEKPEDLQIIGPR
jgi:antitoxin component YwqK of YwqJK toxin-antitoxin module